MPDALSAWFRLAAATGLALLGCGPQTGEGPEAAGEVAPIGGLYEVSGTTVPTAGGEKRGISGKIILAEQGGAYTATFHLNTRFPMGGELMPAEVIGKGEGTVEGRELTGTAHTQLVIATVPGVDTAFAYMPRTVTTRIVSTSTTRIAPDGAVAIEIENRPAEGERYLPTRTTLRGHRVSAAGTGEGPAGSEPGSPPR